MADAPTIKIYAYPAMIYDDAHCSIYQDYMTDISFHFFYVGKKIKDLKSSGTKFYITLPEEIKIIEAGVMDRWKNPTGIYTQFSMKKKVINNRNYIRYELPIPTSVLQPALKKPLPGGMYGGTTNNLVNLMIKPVKTLPTKSMIYWETVGKYSYKGQFSVYPVKLNLKGLKKSRIIIHSFSNLPAFGYSRNAVAEQVRLFKDLKIDSIDTQLTSGANRGFKDLWDAAGFGVHGGSSLMHVFWYNPTGIDARQKIEDRDFLTGINGINGRYINKAAYHHRAFCPQAIITPGRYPNKKLLKLGREAAEAGATWLDIDIEANLCIQCYCSECQEAFFKFSKLTIENLTPEQLVRKYPKEWYYFRNEQTRLLYQCLKDYLKKDFPKLKIGANTVLHGWDKDLNELKYGYCSFAEDPRLMTETLEYIMADTLMGGVYDGITIDAMSKSTKIPIIAIPGSSYCVGYSPGVMCGRRMTAEMTGDNYGYGQRYENHRLGMLHIAASGAAGLRYGINEACIAKATVEAMKILAEMEDFYLDGKRADEHVEVADLTTESSRWNLDTSRIRGGIWKHFYDKWCGKVQSRTHTLNGNYSVGLYNWNPWQNKKWHIRLKNIPAGNWYLTDVTSGKRITLNGKKFWTTNELNKGFIMEIPKLDCRIIKFSKEANSFSGEIVLKCEATSKTPYNQYAWRTGGQHNFEEIMDRQLKRTLSLIKLYGNKTVKEPGIKKATAPAISAIITTLLAADFPTNVDFKDIAKSGIYATVENNAIVSKNNYNFFTMQLPTSPKNLLFTMKVSGENAKFGAQLYNMSGKQIKIVSWNVPVNGSCDMRLIIQGTNLKQPSKLIFYSINKKPISISAMKVELTNKTQVVALKKPFTVPKVSVPFKSDFSKAQTGLSLNGKKAGGKLTISNRYYLGAIYLPAEQPLSATIKLTAHNGATFGLILYELSKKNQLGKVLQRPAWGKKIGQDGEVINIAIQANQKSMVLMMYNVSKKGSIILENIEIGKMK